ncbi:hypothetical protein [Streptomyces hesseae]|uniref:Uncharacterized protein n=1 Tax=Streptomyces hesseae TaxID=3075519 RepID=A0ABU2SXN1_9ACTN|nr:hypothetical protein [Streptomyces sp. DSM 40473]MDT0453763.1 hypothetical protein [Streptomyces sp. DSM 40473]
MNTTTWAADFLAAVQDLHTDGEEVRFTIHTSEEGADYWPAGQSDVRS